MNVTPSSVVSCHYKRWKYLYDRVDQDDWGEAEAKAGCEEMVSLESAVAALPAVSDRDRNLKLELAELAFLDSDGGQALVASVRRDFEITNVPSETDRPVADNAGRINLETHLGKSNYAAAGERQS